ncbi:putative ubiquitinyl hydrolase 1 [Rosa chinensis]|uniref:ubiquitinyl hydrolase 1 n=1 Tax=Rosa chinensis TaxID=74649 RepID=A0A2P6PB44_ROSCH|nr:putative ubiquitinyl hydrolase 1 [Rosa chinensis]
MAASYRTQSAKRWLPLEANPDVMNQFLWGLDVQEGEAECDDVYSLYGELLEMVPTCTCCAVSYPLTPTVLYLPSVYY